MGPYLYQATFRPLFMCGAVGGVVASPLRALWPLRPMLLAPAALGELLTCRLHTSQIVPALACSAPVRLALPQLQPDELGLLDSILVMAAPKKKLSYQRQRVRRSGQLALAGPKPQSHMYMCPVCERMRATHRVCEREDCKAYFRHRWF